MNHTATGRAQRKTVTIHVNKDGEVQHAEPEYFELSPASGLVRRDVLPDLQKRYKYTVRAGGADLDPGGVITK